MSLEPLPDDASEPHLGYPDGMDGEAVENGPASGAIHLKGILAILWGTLLLSAPVLHVLIGSYRNVPFQRRPIRRCPLSCLGSLSPLGRSSQRRPWLSPQLRPTYHLMSRS